MVKPPTLVWKYYRKINIKGKKHGVCNFCEASYQSHAGRMRKHLSVCKKCPEDIKDIFSQKEGLSFLEFKAESEELQDENIDSYYIPDPNYILMDSASNASLDEAKSTEDQFDIFGKYVASELRSIKSERFRNEIKRKILQIIVDITVDKKLEDVTDADID